MRRNGLALLGLLSCLIAALVALGAVPNQGRPPLPIIYSGTVFIQGEEAPEGLAVVACVTDCTEGWQGDAQMTRPGGRYIGLVVGPPSAEDVGEEITLWIVNEFGRIQATETLKFELGDLTRTLDLHFDKPVPTPLPLEPTPTPTVTPTPTITPIPTPTAVLPIPGDPSVSNLSRVALFAGTAALLAGGAILYLLRRRRSL